LLPLSAPAIVTPVVPTAWNAVSFTTPPPPPPPPAPLCDPPPPPCPPAPETTRFTNGRALFGRTKFPEDLITAGNDENAAKGSAKTVVAFTFTLYKETKSLVGAIISILVNGCETFAILFSATPVVTPVPTK
jgi:hypothetical protein